MTTIRPAANTDIAGVVALIDAAYRHYVPLIRRRPRPMDDDQARRVADGELFVLEEAHEIIGVITIEMHPESVHIFNVAVHPDAQARGLLRELIGFAEAAARGAGKGRLTLYTNVLMTRNRSIYAHLGFAETGEEVSPAGYHIVFMERPVPVAS